MHADSNHVFSTREFINSYTKLPSHFYSKVTPSVVPNPRVIHVNHKLATELGLDIESLNSDQSAQIFSGNAIPSGAVPLAQAYAGHQFGYFNPQLGDGRAILLGDILDTNERPKDIQLKGSGPTPYSRNGDGKAAIGPVIREYILSEAMHTLGIKTTRALAAVTTGESVYRQTSHPGAIITRVASSHIRIGTFEYFRSQQSTDDIKCLADYVIERHYPDLQQSSAPYLDLLKAVIDAQAKLIASWMHIGFIHGVMNTDNMGVGGETIDYGPCAFMDTYHPDTVFSSIDSGGRYAYANQPKIALWNLTRFAECLLPLIDNDPNQAVELAETCLQEYSGTYHAYWAQGMRSKLGFIEEREDDGDLIDTLLQQLTLKKIDYTIFFRSLGSVLSNKDHFSKDPMNSWLTQWRSRVLSQTNDVASIVESMHNVNPVYIPRNHLVEEVLAAAETEGDFAPMERLIKVLASPFKEQAGMEHYAQPAPESFGGYKTFCGT